MRRPAVFLMYFLYRTCTKTYCTVRYRRWCNFDQIANFKVICLRQKATKNTGTVFYTGYRTKKLSPRYSRTQCCGSGSGIRCLFNPWIRDPESVFSGSRISDPGSRIPDLGSRISDLGSWIPRPYF